MNLTAYLLKSPFGGACRAKTWKHDICKNVATTICLCGISLIAVGCTTTTQYRTVQVPVRVTCVTTIPAKPTRLTPCAPDVTDSQCVKRAVIDIERLDSALDQSNELLKACQ